MLGDLFMAFLSVFVVVVIFTIIEGIIRKRWGVNMWTTNIKWRRRGFGERRKKEINKKERKGDWHEK